MWFIIYYRNTPSVKDIEYVADMDAKSNSNIVVAK